MKKIYMQPLTEVVKINAESLCIVSNMSEGNSYGGTTVLDKDDDYEGYDPNLF